ncbi:hypothetical protein MTYM_02223 [Methylococcales bacterium]|nr:hypothetical protein MTYM_02223 [Methylococcales bacterium]
MSIDGIVCMGCGKPLKYTMLADAICACRCKKGCGAGVIITHSVMTDALSTMIENQQATLLASE